MHSKAVGVASLAFALAACGERGAAATKETAAAAASSGTTPTAVPPPAPPGTKPATYTKTQATRGEQVYQAVCARCHVLSAFSGAAFETTWSNRRVFDLYDWLSNTMPQDDPGSLSTQQYVDVIAYILKVNGMQAGKSALPSGPEAMKQLRIEVHAANGSGG